MQTFKQHFKQILAVLLFSAVFSGFIGAAETGDTHHAQSTQEWPGVYNGFLPCDDCKGIKTTLALNNNGTYILMTQFVGKSPRDFVEKGKFAWNADSNTLVLTSRDGSTKHEYGVDENNLVKLDDNGNRVSGKLAERYILRRNVMPEARQQHAAH